MADDSRNMASTTASRTPTASSSGRATGTASWPTTKSSRNAGGNTYGLINFAEDVQDLLIERVVNLLKHKNPYTGKT